MANLIRLPEVQKITGMSRAGIYKAMATGAFPTQIPIGERAVAWIDAEVFDWRDAKIDNARDQGPTQPIISKKNCDGRQPGQRSANLAGTAPDLDTDRPSGC